MEGSNDDGDFGCTPVFTFWNVSAFEKMAEELVEMFKREVMLKPTMDAQRALLDELMGSGRNMTNEERRGLKEIKWYDKEVCEFYMVRFCPHDLFVNTRSDLGACSRIHDPKLKESFEKSSRHDFYAPKFEAELVQFCKRLVNDLDNKLRRGRDRLAVDTEPPPPEQLETLKNLLEQVEALGEEGKVDEAEALMRKVETLNTEKTVLVQRPNDKVLTLVHKQKMELCEVCGSLLQCNDAEERTQSHVTGKQHVGYVMVRDFLAEQKAAKDKEKEEERLRRGNEADDKRKQREKGSEINRSGSRDRERYVDRDRDRDGDRHRDRGRNQREPYDRRSWRGRSRSRSPHGRSSHRRVSRS